MHAQSYLTLCNTMDCSPSGSSVHGIYQLRILEWVAIFCISCIAGGFFTAWVIGRNLQEIILSMLCYCVQLLQLYPNIYGPIDCIPPGSSVHGIFQARMLDGVVFSFSRGSFQPRDWTRVSHIFCFGRWILYH